MLLASLLLTSIDGALDIAKSGHPHEDVATQLADVSDTVVDTLHDSDDGDGSSTPDHCEHCCHGHTSVVMPIAASPHFECGVATHGPYADASVPNLSQAPPTPPPNA